MEVVAVLRVPRRGSASSWSRGFVDVGGLGEQGDVGAGLDGQPDGVGRAHALGDGPHAAEVVGEDQAVEAEILA